MRIKKTDLAALVVMPGLTVFSVAAFGDRDLTMVIIGLQLLVVVLLLARFVILFKPRG